MTKQYPPLLVLLAIALAASGCATEHANEDTTWSSEQQAAYDQCLQDNMAVATAWEMIEQSCREQVTGSALGLGVEE